MKCFTSTKLLNKVISMKRIPNYKYLSKVQHPSYYGTESNSHYFIKIIILISNNQIIKTYLTLNNTLLPIWENEYSRENYQKN